MNDDQLVLLDDETAPEAASRRAWRLDEHTREIGRRGVAQAREALRQAAPSRAA